MNNFIKNFIINTIFVAIAFYLGRTSKIGEQCAPMVIKYAECAAMLEKACEMLGPEQVIYLLSGDWKNGIDIEMSGDSIEVVDSHYYGPPKKVSAQSLDSLKNHGNQ